MRPVSKRYLPKQILSVSLIFLGIFILSLLIPEQSNLLFFIFPFVAISQGLSYPNATAIVSNLGGKDSQGEILGINQSIQSLGMSIPPIIAGFISALDVRLPIVVSALCLGLAWAVFVFLFKDKKEVFHEV